MRLRWASIGIQEIKVANRKNDGFVVLKVFCQDGVYVHPICKERIIPRLVVKFIKVINAGPHYTKVSNRKAFFGVENPTIFGTSKTVFCKNCF